jgi:hypothetical protein
VAQLNLRRLGGVRRRRLGLRYGRRRDGRACREQARKKKLKSSHHFLRNDRV